MVSASEEQGDGNLSETQRKRWWKFEHFLACTLSESDIENFKWLFQIEDDEVFGGKFTCLQLITINKELSNY